MNIALKERRWDEATRDRVLSIWGKKRSSSLSNLSSTGKASNGMASSAASSSGRFRRRVVLLRQPSREEDYEPPRRYCNHRMLAARWTSWTDGNPGRRFYGCPLYNQDGACGFFAWHDNEFGERANTVINELLDDIDKLYDENCNLRRAEHGQRLSVEIDVIHGELRKLKRRNELYDGELRKGKKKFKVAMTLLFVTCVWLCVLYLKV